MIDITKFLPNRAIALKKKSSNAMNVFKTAVEKLVAVNTEIEAEQGIIADRIIKLDQDLDSLTVDRKANAKMINKINDFFLG